MQSIGWGAEEGLLKLVRPAKHGSAQNQGTRPPVTRVLTLDEGEGKSLEYPARAEQSTALLHRVRLKHLDSPKKRVCLRTLAGDSR